MLNEIFLDEGKEERDDDDDDERSNEWTKTAADIQEMNFKTR